MKRLFAAPALLFVSLTVSPEIVAAPQSPSRQPPWSSAAMTVTIADSFEFPFVMISNDSLLAKIYLPHSARGYYRGSRFDWSGLIGELNYRGHTCYRHWDYAPHDPLNPEHAIGPADEFDITRPRSFSSAPAPAEFVKIGIGVLTKPQGDTSYWFNKAYAVAAPAPWEVELGAQSVTFRQKLSHPATGVAYLYIKRISIDGASLSVRHTLENLGKDSLITTPYCHNLFVLDGDTAGPAYQVRFAVKPAPNEWQMRNIKEYGRLDSTLLRFTKKIPGNASLPIEFGPVPPALSEPLAVIRNTRSGLTVRVSTDPAPSRFAFWAKMPVCPEPFFDLRIAPRARATWTYNYQFTLGK